MSERDLPSVPDRKPAFDGGTFTIDFISPSPLGFSIQTDKALRPREDQQGVPFPLTPAQKASAGKAVRSDVLAAQKEAGIDTDKRAAILAQIKNRPPESTLDKLLQQLAETITPQQREDYATSLTASRKVGVRNPRQEGNILILDEKAPYFGLYKTVSNPSETIAALELANPAGNAVILQTADGKMVLQYRKPYQVEKIGDKEKRTGNFFYGGIPGASIAGMFDAQKGEKSTGHPKPIDNNDVKRSVSEEAQHEIGLSEEHITSFSISGLARDNIRVHSEFLGFATTDLTFEQLRNQKQYTQEREYEFSEKFFAIDAKPQAIEILLTQVQCPLPPTHAAAYIAAGYAMTIEENLRKGLSQDKALQEAETWKAHMQQGVQENYRKINSKVISYWATHQEEAQQHAEDRPPHNIFGYDAAYSPSEQGLPSLEEELTRTNLR